MNIFFTSLDPYTCAQALDDKRLNKMILETAQILSNTVRHMCEEQPEIVARRIAQAQLSETELDKLYKRTHWNHPSCRWARVGITNYTWLVHHFHWLAFEKLNRDKYKGKTNAKYHLSYKKLYPLFSALCATNVAIITQHDLVGYIAVDDDLKVYEPIEAYRKHMIHKWLSDTNPKWTSCKPPKWFIDILECME